MNRKEPRRVPSLEEMNEHVLALSRGITAQLFAELGNKVMAGPFAGMIIPEEPIWDDGNSATKLLGCYEFELHGVLQRIVSERRPDVVINVGCAEGYYAIGFARAFGVPVYAFDINPDSVSMCYEYAERNGVGDLVAATVLKHVPASLRFPALIGPRKKRLYFIDVEGDEFELLNKVECPPLAKSDIIVECHEFLIQGVTAALTKRFQDTHDIELINTQLPPLACYPFLHGSPMIMTALTVTEKRPAPTCWLACWAKDRT